MILRRETWLPAPRDVRLSGDDVHLWRASLEPDASAVERLRATLTADERQRAQRFHFERDRLRFVVARGLLRDILGRYLQHPPALIRFTYNEYGKPALAEDGVELRFNVSHSQGAALYAFTRGREVGVDIESLRDDFASLEIAERFFSRAEMCELNSLPTHLRTQAFFNCWTRKEAYIKALGEGLSHPLDCFAVSLKPQEPARLVSTDSDPSEAARWTIIDLNPFQGYAAAVAIRVTNPELHCWDWRWQ
ncbi:MAG TPA: 4'-phosphopantetheinyl transferase superfamily protein [Pyrinomonadaceae bacterium]|jgi:4'-phosphopantetheinyl transferase